MAATFVFFAAEQISCILVKYAKQPQLAAQIKSYLKLSSQTTLKKNGQNEAKNNVKHTYTHTRTWGNIYKLDEAWSCIFITKVLCKIKNKKVLAPSLPFSFPFGEQQSEQAKQKPS